jgi:uncharacterized protein YaaQ
MKVILVVVQDTDARELLSRLMEEDFRATMVSTTGGFLRTGSAAILIGTERVDEAKQVIADTCKRRTEIVNPMPPVAPQGAIHISPPIEVEVGGAMVFVLNAERFESF